MVATISSVVWGLHGCQPFPKIHGTIAAQIDVIRGWYKHLGYGLPVPWTRRYTSTLRNHYGVESESVANCRVSPYLKRYVRAYNHVSETAANRRFGHDVFRETFAEAASDWKREHPER